ncbi:MAG TPA: ACP phosphodiesterase [Bacteroidia bacterium]|nr:ACP phosphodiesterase [Bacteroidia bacterium]
MNFLAHLYLSKHAEELMIGNFIADAVKGKNFEAFSPGVIQGIKMHREIDAFTDTHHITKISAARLMPRYRKYAGVLVDVFYDHFLAANWSKYHHQPLPNFVDGVYDLMQKNFNILPAKSQYLLPYMIKHNWLLNYAKVEGIQRTLSGMANRTKFVSNMQFATEELEIHYQEFEQEFKLFFEDARKHFGDLY